MSIEEPENLEEWFCRLKTHEDRIFVRYQANGKWTNAALSSLPPEDWAKYVARWLNESSLPVYVRDEP